ncbi:hypothetical protein HJC99_04885 [Candidatus Saccharibacteria bacterium]|nr:hypothetical protein [Candidatus Saccharibacteria bacterium]
MLMKSSSDVNLPVTSVIQINQAAVARAALTQINLLRAALGAKPRRTMSKGAIRGADICPVHRTLRCDGLGEFYITRSDIALDPSNAAAVRRSWGSKQLKCADGPQCRKVHFKLPRDVSLFVENFDDGLLPGFDENRAPSAA